ncbi:MAG: hypothetical protein ACPGYV_10685 [Phycisphaeraceae bacterium]
MTRYEDNDETYLSEQTDSDDGLNTMAVLSTLGGGDDVNSEGEPLGLDPEAGKAKVSGSSLAVGVVVVLGAVTLLGMKLTLGSFTSVGPSEAMAEIDSFIALQNAAQTTGVEGPVKAPDEESQKVLEELKQDPTDHQVPPEEVESNPFDISQIVARQAAPQQTEEAAPDTDPRELAVKRARAAAGKLTIDGIAGTIVFIDGKDYRAGDAIGDGTFELVSIDGLTCIIRTTDEFKIALRLRYR